MYSQSKNPSESNPALACNGPVAAFLVSAYWRAPSVRISVVTVSSSLLANSAHASSASSSVPESPSTSRAVMSNLSFRAHGLPMSSPTQSPKSSLLSAPLRDDFGCQHPTSTNRVVEMVDVISDTRDESRRQGQRRSLRRRWRKIRDCDKQQRREICIIAEGLC